MNRPQILEAVEALRQRKCRPEREAIAHFILRKYGTQFQEIFSDLETVVDQGDLVKVEYKGSTSYRNPEAFDTKASPLLTKHSKILNSNRTVRFILTAVSELLAENDSYNKEGIPLEAIQTKLISYDSARFTPTNVPIFIDREIAVGSLVVLAGKQGVLPKDLYHSLPQETEQKSTPSPNARMRGRKAAAATIKTEITPTTSAVKVEPESTEVFAVKSAPPLPVTPTTPTTSKPVRAYGRKSAASAEKDKDAETATTKSYEENEMPSFSNSAEESVEAKEGEQMPSLTLPEETSTGRSVRNKRKKEVFDPSDIPKKRPSVTTPTVVVKQEKEKPVSASKPKATPSPKTPSKRGRKKKQPANADDKEPVVTILCGHCQRHKNIKGQFETFLICSDCLVHFHASCLDYEKSQASLLIAKGTWQCSDCKACQVCQESAKGPEAILCSKCDMGMHYKCLKLGKKPAEGSWLCPGCKGEGEADQAESSTGTVDPDVKIKEEKPEIKEEREEADEPSSDAMRKKPAAKAARPPPKKRILTLKLEKKGDEGEVKVEEKCMPQQPVPVVPSAGPTTGGRDEIKKEEEDVIPLDASKWTPAQVEAYFKKHGLREEGILFREQEIDGLSLLLMRRQDIVHGMKLLLGPALKVFKLVVKLQQSGGKVEDSKIIL